jgi:hypothetical protein
MNTQEIQQVVTPSDASWLTALSASGSARNTIQVSENKEISVSDGFQRTNKVQSAFDDTDTIGLIVLVRFLHRRRAVKDKPAGVSRRA